MKMTISNRAAIYARVSTEEQATQGYSIQAQLEELRRYAQFQQLDILGEYVDEGASGKSISGRIEMKRLLKDVQKGMFDFVLFYKLDRIARDLKDALEISDILDQNNVKMYVHVEKIDTSTSSGKMYFQIMGSVAEFERNTIVDRVKMGMTQRAKEGNFNGGQCLGYDSVDKTLVINEEEAAIVREIFSLSEQGLGYKAIVSRLNAKGYITKRGKQFSVSGVKQILDNPMYIGKIRFNQVEFWTEKRRKGKNEDYLLVDGKHKPIIELEQWERVQGMRKKRSYKPSRSDEPYILAGIIRCPMCGGGMVAGRSKGGNGTTYRNYVCGQHHNKGKTACRANTIRADRAETEVFQRISDLISSPSVLKRIIEKVNEQRLIAEQPLVEHQKLIKNKLNQASKKLDNLLDALADGTFSKATLAPKIRELEEQKASLEQQLEKLSTSLSETDTAPIDYEAVRRLLADFQSTLNNVDADQRKALLRMIIKDITISRDAPHRIGRHVEKINLHFDFTFEAMTDSFELVKQLYPEVQKDLEPWKTASRRYEKKPRDYFESLPILPLAMVRFTVP
jgi:site-specific DNA recombinase